MMPDLGKYAGTVLAAYGVTALLLAAMIALSLIRSYRTARELDRLEIRRQDTPNG